MSTLNVEALNGVVELTDPAGQIYKGRLVTPIMVGQEVKVILDPQHYYYISKLKKALELVGDNSFTIVSGDNKKFKLRVIEMENP